jgi:hypothetical protein
MTNIIVLKEIDRLTDEQWSGVTALLGNAISHVDTDGSEYPRLLLDVNTGDWLTHPSITGSQGARLAASLLPGMNADVLDRFYGEWISDDSPAHPNGRYVNGRERKHIEDIIALGKLGGREGKALAFDILTAALS